MSVKDTLLAFIKAKEVFMTIPSPAYRSLELEQIQQRSTSPLGMLFLRVPAIQISVPAHQEGASTRTCDETTNDGTSKLDCIDDDD
jgi:hypothetical protein